MPTITTIRQKINLAASRVHWPMLAFLLTVLNVKIIVKLIAIIAFLVFNRKLFRENTLYNKKFTWFYAGLILISCINLLLLIPHWSVNNIVLTAVGILFWAACIATALLNSWFVLNTDLKKLHTTISLFFILNILVTCIQLALVIADADSINPYTYQGMHQRYFIGTGDLMTGISFDVSTTNALLNAMGLVYFLSRNKMNGVLVCMATLLLTASNFTNILLLLVLLFIFVFRSTRNQKSVIICCLFFLLVFVVKISPQNNQYVIDAYNRVTGKKIAKQAVHHNNDSLLIKPDSLLSPEELKKKTAVLYLDSLNKSRTIIKLREEPLKPPSAFTGIDLLKKPIIPRPSIHTEPFQRKKDTSIYQRELLSFAEKKIPAFDTSFRDIKARRLPGKLLAFKQTLEFFRQHPLKIITGDGVGNFSSKLAFRATGLAMAGGYPKRFVRVGDDFTKNHLDLYLSYFSKDIELHSLVNSPNCVYDQLLSEYGILGILAFLFLYLGFFLQQRKKLTYGIPLLLLLLGAFWVDYWYEQLSIVIVFELLMLVNIKENERHA